MSRLSQLSSLTHIRKVHPAFATPWPLMPGSEYVDQFDNCDLTVVSAKESVKVPALLASLDVMSQVEVLTPLSTLTHCQGATGEQIRLCSSDFCCPGLDKNLSLPSLHQCGQRETATNLHTRSYTCYTCVQSASVTVDVLDCERIECNIQKCIEVQKYSLTICQNFLFQTLFTVVLKLQPLQYSWVGCDMLFPECVARVPVSLWGSGGEAVFAKSCVCVRNRLCCVTAQPSAWGT